LSDFTSEDVCVRLLARQSVSHLLNNYTRFGGICCLYLQSPGIPRWDLHP